MSEFSIKFRGVRGSYPVADKNFLKYGGNTACVEINVGGRLIILDAGSGIISVGNDLMEQYITSSLNPEERKPIRATVLLSHIHQDHIQGFTFFRPLHLKSTKINVFGNLPPEQDLKTELSEIIFGKSFPLDLKDIAGTLNIKNIKEEEIILLYPDGTCKVMKLVEYISPQEGDVVIQNYKSYAHPKDGVVVYKISYKGKSVVFATDKESYMGGDKKLIDFAKNCDVLIHDAQYTTEDYLDQYSSKQGYGHSTFDMAIEVQKQTNASKLVFFHFDPNYDDEKLDRISEKYTSQEDNKVVLAQEDLNIDLL